MTAPNENTWGPIPEQPLDDQLAECAELLFAPKLTRWQRAIAFLRVRLGREAPSGKSAQEPQGTARA